MENCIENLDENKGFKSFAFIKKHPVWSLVIAYVLFTATTFGNMYTLSTFGLCGLSIAIVAAYAYLAYKIIKSNGFKGINAALYYSVIILFSILLCCFFCIAAKNNQHLFAFFIAVVLIFAYLAVCVYTEVKQKIFSIDTVIAAIFILAYFFRLFYVLYTGYGTRQHDLYLKGEKGHFYYVKYIYENFSLPKENIMTSQMYHPPFHHIVCAAALRFWSLFGVDYIVAYEGLQILTLTESMITLYVCYRILKEVGLKKEGLKNTGLIASLCVLAVHPTFILLSGSLNNDNLSVMFAMCSIYFAIKWHKNKTLRNIIAIALSIGLGMMTKLSVWMVAPSIAIMFLLSLFSKTEDKKMLVKQFVVFGVICLPLGLFWSVRNYFLCGMPFGYVLEQSVKSAQYVGNSSLSTQTRHTVLDRLFNFRLYQLESVFTQNRVVNGKAPYNDFNPTIGILKSAMFEESLFANIEFICTIAFYSSVLLALISVVSAVWVFAVDKSRDGVVRMILGGTTLLVTASFYLFCLIYPHVCTMSARYAVPAIAINIFAVGMAVDKLQNLKNRKAGKVLSYIIIVIAAIFVLSSVGVYCAVPFN